MATCALCQQSRDLRNSHLVPKGLYRLARARAGHDNPNPVLITATGRMQTSYQAVRPLLCAECEQRFNQQGEDWVLKHCYRGYGLFRLRELLRGSAPLHSDVLLLVSAGFIYWYLWETRKMRKAAQDQVDKSQELVEAAQRQIDVGQQQVRAGKSQVTAAFRQLEAIHQQIELAQDQLEGQIRPALVARINQHGVELVNIGSGPALHVQLSPAVKGSGALLAVHPFPEPHDQISFLEPIQVRQTVVQCQVNPHYPEAPVLDGRSLQCTYKSLSGRIHYTVIDFSGGKVDDTRFYEREPE